MDVVSIAIIAILAGFGVYVCIRLILAVQHWWASAVRRERPRKVLIDHWFAAEVVTADAVDVEEKVATFNAKLMSYRDPDIRVVQPIGVANGTVTYAVSRSASTLYSFRRVYVFVLVRQFEGGVEWSICGSEFRVWKWTERHFSHFTFRRGHMAKAPGKHHDVTDRTDGGAYVADAAMSLVSRLWHETMNQAARKPRLQAATQADNKESGTGQIKHRLSPYIPIGIASAEGRTSGSQIKDRRRKPRA